MNMSFTIDLHDRYFLGSFNLLYSSRGICRGLGYNIISEILPEKENHPHRGGGGVDIKWNGTFPYPSTQYFFQTLVFLAEHAPRIAGLKRLHH